MKEYANLINAFIDAVNRGKTIDCHSELVTLTDIAVAATKFRLYETIGLEACTYLSDLDDLVKKLINREMSIEALLNRANVILETIHEEQHLPIDRFTTTINYIKMMTE